MGGPCRRAKKLQSWLCGGVQGERGGPRKGKPVPIQNNIKKKGAGENFSKEALMTPIKETSGRSLKKEGGYVPSWNGGPKNDKNKFSSRKKRTKRPKTVCSRRLT